MIWRSYCEHLQQLYPGAVLTSFPRWLKSVRAAAAAANQMVGQPTIGVHPTLVPVFSSANPILSRGPSLAGKQSQFSLQFLRQFLFEIDERGPCQILKAYKRGSTFLNL